MNMTDRFAAVKAIADGITLDPANDRDKLLKAAIDLLGEMADYIDALQQDVLELDSYVETLDDDLADLEDSLYGDEPDDEEEEEAEAEAAVLVDGDLIHYACPSCGKPITFRAADVDLEEDFLCPDCGKPVFPELEDDDEDDEE